jgi:hypothetical protein
LAYDSFEDVQVGDHIACPECQGKLPRMSCKDPAGHRAHARSMRPQRELEQFPILADLEVEARPGEPLVLDAGERAELGEASVDMASCAA